MRYRNLSAVVAGLAASHGHLAARKLPGAPMMLVIAFAATVAVLAAIAVFVAVGCHRDGKHVRAVYEQERQRQCGAPQRQPIQLPARPAGHVRQPASRDVA